MSESFQRASRRIVAVAIITALGLCSACSTNPATGRSEVVFMDRSDEIALGARMHQQILDRQPVYDDPAIQDYINFVGQGLAAKSDRPLLPWQFTVLDSPDVNAFALPGGFIYVNRGLLAYLQSEAELAAVLGHEIAHVTARHQARQHRNATLAGIAGWMVALGTGVGAAGDITNIAGTAMIRGYGRNLELEADRLGAAYMVRGGYDHEAMLDVIGVLKEHQTFQSDVARAEGGDGQTYHGVFASHPKNDQRLQEVVRAAKDLDSDKGGERFVEDYAKRIDGLVYGDNVAQGVVRNGNFYHEPLELAFAIPAGYRVKNTDNAVFLIAPGGDAAIVMTRTARDDTLSPQQFIVQKLKVKQLQNGRARDNDGLRGYQGDYAKGHVAVVYKDSGAYIFNAQRRKGSTRQSLPQEFDGVVASFHRLTPRERASARPWRLRHWTVAPGWTYARLAQISPLGNNAEAHLRLLNGDYPDNPLQAGRRIRIVE